MIFLGDSFKPFNRVKKFHFKSQVCHDYQWLKEGSSRSSTFLGIIKKVSNFSQKSAQMCGNHWTISHKPIFKHHWIWLTCLLYVSLSFVRRNVFVIFLYHIQSLDSLKQTWKACYKVKMSKEMGGKLLAFTLSLISTLAVA